MGAKHKLIIQIPCYNEEETLPLVLKDVPTSIDGIDCIETQIVDDGSTDNTVEVAKRLGINHIVSYTGNKGLGNAFRYGVESALKKGATILVNSDGDNQYKSSDIVKLIQPILQGDADIVVGDRQTAKIKHFSVVKKFFQWLGTKVTVSLAGERELKDAVSGFRAYSRDALVQLNVTSSFSYVLDTTLQAASKRIRMVSVPIETNPPTRPSRLFKNMFQHIRKSSVDIVRVYAMYHPLKIFLWLGGVTFFLGSIPMLRFLYSYFFTESGGAGKIQSLIFGAMLIIISINFFALGIIGDLLSKNRILSEYILEKLKKEDTTT